MKAIETQYKGYRFRSRLEARWAVFFDQLGIEWQYEIEGFRYDGGYYLPDFYLPKMGLYVEVKPDDSAVNQVHLEAMRKADKPILLVVGDPANDEMTLYAYSMNDSGGGYFTSWVYFGVDDKVPVLVIFTRHDTLFFADASFSTPLSCTVVIDERRTDARPDLHHRVVNSKLYARQKRFEHGE